jgi:hypothetical protein
MTHLRLVSDAARVRKPPPRLTADQVERLGIALKNLHRLYGTWRALADEMGMSTPSLHRAVAGRNASFGMAVRAAELARVPVERLLSGSVADADTCPECGRKR